MNKDYSVKFVSVVVPVYNEEGCLQELIDRVLTTLDTLKCASGQLRGNHPEGRGKTARSGHRLHPQPELRPALRHHGGF